MFTIKALMAVAVFFSAYVLIATEKVNKTIVAILGASLVIFLQLVTFDQAIKSIDMNVIFLLVGMMTAVYVLAKTGFFEWVAIVLAKRAKGEPLVILIMLLSATCFLSAFLDNVTTVIMMAPMTILIMQLLEVSPVPALILEAIASNIGGTATLIGDPPNIIIGSRAGLSFNAFLGHLTPVVILVFLALVGTMALILGKKFIASDDIKKRLQGAIPHLAIVDKRNMIKALSVIALTFLGFFLSHALGLEVGIIALAGGMIILVVCKAESDDTLMRVEWGVIFFFIGMFIMIGALEANGVVELLGNGMIDMAGNNLLLMCLVILWGSAFFAAVLNNIPFVIAMVPLVKHVVAYFAQANGITDPALITSQIAYPLWWSLALGACLGGNGTLIGASANMVVARIGERNGCSIKFSTFFAYGFPLMIQSILICTAYIWLRYFAFR